MALTSRGRFQDALAYIRTHVDQSLAQAVIDAARPVGEATLGGQISLEGHGFHGHGTKAQHMALRALLLCQRTFLYDSYVVPGFSQEVPSIQGGLRNDEGLAIRLYKDASEHTIREAIRAYTVVNYRSRDMLTRFMRSDQITKELVYYEGMTRNTRPLPGNGVCYDGVKMGLFAAGFVSLRWLATIGKWAHIDYASDIFGMGTIVPPGNINQIPSGYIFVIHNSANIKESHWGVSLGGGICAAYNTTPAWRDAQVNFITGNATWGKFRLSESIEVLKRKFSPNALANITTRQIDPARIRAF